MFSTDRQKLIKSISRHRLRYRSTIANGQLGGDIIHICDSDQFGLVAVRKYDRISDSSKR